MILSFKKKFPWGTPTDFEQKILSGTKIHTIREDPHGRWKPGRKAHLANGVRTKNYNCFKEGVCISIQDIEIIHYHEYRDEINIVIDGVIKFAMNEHRIFNQDFMNQLAKNDGFESKEDFFKWFDKDFQGKIIHWTDFRY